MKFVRYGKNKQATPKPGCVDAQGFVRDLSHLLSEIDAPSILTHQKQLSSQDLHLLPKIGKVSELHLFPCIVRPGKLIGIAFNSKIHTKEMGETVATEPVFFLKATSAIVGPNDPLIYSKIAEKVDWEAELGVIIGKAGKHIPKESAFKHILGYCCLNDFSDRGWQFEHPGGQLTKAKSFDSFAPMGPYLVTSDQIQNPNNLQVQLRVNGVERQNFSTSDYQFSVEEVIAFISKIFTLESGDVISMGSGPGNAKFWGGCFLKPGDEIEFEIESLGMQRKSVVAET